MADVIHPAAGFQREALVRDRALSERPAQEWRRPDTLVIADRRAAPSAAE